jgi:tetraacyldisaccharide 4'-kinase
VSQHWLESIWYRDSPPPAFMLPLASAYGAVADRLAANNKQRAVKLPVPVIVVGNIAIGGTGKTPFTLWLIDTLRAMGRKPGIVSRGYGGRSTCYPLRVTSASDPDLCGDEPALIARRAKVPLAVAPDRVAAALLLIESGEVDVIVADDGLQHYRLARDLEICVVDGTRGVGNGARLPAGPLREPPSRLASVGLVIVNGGEWAEAPTGSVPMTLATATAKSLTDDRVLPLADFAGQRVHAVAGIGNPSRFFASLRAAGLDPVEHPFPDHHRYAEIDLAYGGAAPVLMTEKDAVKCSGFQQLPLWRVPAQAVIAAEHAARVRESLARILR